MTPQTIVRGSDPPQTAFRRMRAVEQTANPVQPRAAPPQRTQAAQTILQAAPLIWRAR
jgi:hypothetical protein